MSKRIIDGDIVHEVAEQIAKNHARILDDFIKAYAASRWDDYFKKQKKVDFSRIELVVQFDKPGRMIYSCRLRKGKLPTK